MLVILAHPDDEVFGAGGTLLKLKDSGVPIHIAFAGKGRPSGSQVEDAKRVADKAGWRIVAQGDFPDQQFEHVGVKTLSEWASDVIAKYASGPIGKQLIITHSAHDANYDHKLIFHAVRLATRPGRGVTRNHEIWACEIPGNYLPGFDPTIYYDISRHWNRKAELAAMYSAETTYERSVGALETHARWAGLQAGFLMAERFELVRLTIGQTSGTAS